MLRTLPQTRDFTSTQRLLAIASMSILTALSARLSVEIGLPVPFTFQVMVVLLSGMLLGGRDAAISQAAYVSLIASGVPIDARGLGTAALTGPTGGYLLGFIAAAALVGFLVEKTPKSWLLYCIAGVLGVALIYLFGISVLKFNLALTWSAAWQSGGAAFWHLDLIKAILAAFLAQSGRHFFLYTQHNR